MDKDAKLSVIQDGEEEMATIPCVECGREHEFINNYASGHNEMAPHDNDVLKGVLYCGYCHAPTVFTIKAKATTFLPGKLLRQNLITGRNINAETMIGEALKCFYGASYVGVVAMCRSAITEAILGKGIGNRNDSVPSLMTKAKISSLVDATDEVRAESARLIAREALHYMGDVNEDDALFAIRAAVEFVNNVGGRTPSPATQ